MTDASPACAVPSSYPVWLLGALAVWFACWAIAPPHPGDFAIEHILTALAVGLLVWTRRNFPLSHFSYTCIFLFLALHIVGAHYTYSEVPYESWLSTVASWFGATVDLRASLGWTRNHYDRLVHFSFGLLLAYPVRELFLRIVQVKGFWGYYLPLDVMMAMSMAYELIEWGVAVVIAGDVGQSYLGTQGDEWDSQKDMALATLGALIAMAVTAVLDARGRRGFAAEFRDSLRVHDRKPREPG